MNRFGGSCVLLAGWLLASTNAGAQLQPVVEQSVLGNPLAKSPAGVTNVLKPPTSVPSTGAAIPGVKLGPGTSPVGNTPLVSAPSLIKVDRIPSTVTLTSREAARQIGGTGMALPTIALPDGSLSTNLRSTAPSTSDLRLLAPAAVPAARELLRGRELRHHQLLRAHSRELETDDVGRPVLRGVLVVMNLDPQSLRRAAKAGYRLIRVEPHGQLGINVAHLAVPAGLTAPRALSRLRRMAPQLQADFDHLFEPSGGRLDAASRAPLANGGKAPGRARIGMIDGGVAAHPALAGAAIEQRGFSGAPQATRHGTAVASLVVGHRGRFHGAACGASLFVADVYGGKRAAGSASALVRAMDWLASKQPRVINISLVGPPNRVLERAIQALRARGIQVVAAVGNDGPAAPPQYPASYPGVIAVTGVDGRGKALFEAGRPTHLDFAAPGADMAAAVPGQTYARVRGTSFAAPFVTSRLAKAGTVERLAAEARPGAGRIGRGIVCFTCRVDPRAVSATGNLFR